MYKSIKKKIRTFKRWMAFDPPSALSSNGWNSFNSEFKKVAPIRWWFHRDAKKIFVYPVSFRYRRMMEWIHYRTTARRYHIIKTGLTPGYYDVSTMMLHANFTVLKDFVEIEQAWMQSCSEKNRISLWARYVPFYRIFFPFRRPDLGIEYLNWCMTLDDPSLPVHERADQQATDARETWALYDWWVNKRPVRKEIDIMSYRRLMSDVDIFDTNIDTNSSEYKGWFESMEARDKQQEEWDDEDEQMLIRLIKIRKRLWT
jgi:hypothetical protein